MKKYSLVTTYYCYNCQCPTKEQVKHRFMYDGNIDDLFINFSSEFDPWNKDNLNVGVSGRKDLIYGKIFLLRDFIRNNILNRYEYVCHIDYSDTKFARSFIDMMNNFILTDDDFIISTEKVCWPYIDHVRKWIDYPIEDKEFKYINSGAIISKTNIFYNYLVELSEICLNNNIDFWDDQGVWQYYNLKIKKLNADETCKYFFSTGLLDNTYYKFDDNHHIITKFGTNPYLIHDNSSFSLNLTQKI